MSDETASLGSESWMCLLTCEAVWNALWTIKCSGQKSVTGI